MKRSSYFLQSQLLLHLPFILLTALGLVLIVIIFMQFLDKYRYFTTSITAIEKDITEARNKNSTLSRLKNQDKQDIQSFNKLLTQLIPPQEDYFSLFNALEILAQHTNLSIVDYSINPQTNKAEKITLEVVMAGSQEAFLNFLDKYKFAGGRLITMEKVQLNNDFSVSRYKIEVNFYAKKVATQSGQLNIQQDKSLQFLREIRNQVVQASDEGTILTGYERKDNPF